MNTQDVNDFLAHYGVKGMKWGIRRSQGELDRLAGRRTEASKGPSGFRLQTPTASKGSNTTVAASLHATTKKDGVKVSSKIKSKYGFSVSSIKDLKESHPAEYKLGTVGFVKHTPGQKGGDVYIRPGDIRGALKEAEKQGWFASGTGNIQAFITHESAHAMFHAEQRTQRGLVRNKVVGGHMKARDKALSDSIIEAKRSNIPETDFVKRVSGYAAASGTREELEAELFSQYHWSPNPPSFVRTWGETLHKEMGVDPTPFREMDDD